MDVYDYFEKTGRADNGAPIAFLSDNEDFVLMGEQAGFKAKFIDCAFSIADLNELAIPFPWWCDIATQIATPVHNTLNSGLCAFQYHLR